MTKSDLNLNAARQAAFRARKAAAGAAEVRGIFATPEQTEQIRRYATRLIKTDIAARLRIMAEEAAR